MLQHPQLIEAPIQPPCRRHLAQGTLKPIITTGCCWEMGSGRRKPAPLGWSPGQRCPWHWDFWLWLASVHISLQHTQPQPLPWLITSLTFIFGDSWLLLFHLPVKGRLFPPWENSLSVDQRQEKHNHTCSQKSPLATAIPPLIILWCLSRCLCFWCEARL